MPSVLTALNLHPFYCAHIVPTLTHLQCMQMAKMTFIIYGLEEGAVGVGVCVYVRACVCLSRDVFIRFDTHIPC